METRRKRKLREQSEKLLEGIMLHDKLGGGKFGKIYKATWNQTTYAVKVLRPAFTEDKWAVKCFDKEIELHSYLQSLNSDYIVKFFAGISVPGDRKIIMEYMAGGNLADRYEDETAEPFVWQMRYQIMFCIASGVQAMHGANILHRDLKPENVLLTADGQAKLCDFGLSDHDGIEPEYQVGTLYYLAPETENSWEEFIYTKKTDIYALGLMIWEIASWQMAFNEIMDKELSEAQEIRQIHELKESGCPEPVDELPPKVAHLVKWCWSVDSQKRPEIDEVVKQTNSFRS